MTSSKKHREALALVDRLKKYTFEDAVDLLLGMPKAKFDETVEIAVRLGVDPRHADQMVRGTVALPAGTGRAVRVAVFA
jgi:large subunit ribosomal protein L1